VATQNGSGGPSNRHSEAIRRAAVRLRVEEGLTAAQVSDRLQSEHGATVPRSTVAAWLALAALDRPIPKDLKGSIGDQAARVLRLTDSEIRRLEAKKGPTDLERLSRIASILKVTESLKTASPQAGKAGKASRARTLDELDLGSEEETAEGEAF